MNNKTGVKGPAAKKALGSPRNSGTWCSPTTRMTRQNQNQRTGSSKPSENESTVPCNVDKKLLDSLIRSLQGLRRNLNDENQNQAHGGVDPGDVEADPSDLNNVLHHLLRAVNDLTHNIQVVKDQCDRIEKAQDTTVAELKSKMRINEDEMDECKQRSLKGNFIISSLPDPSKQRASLLKTDEQLRQDKETLTDHVLDLAKKKYNVTISAGEVQACHRLPNNSVILRLWRRCPGSVWQDLVEKIKSGTNAGFNVYFNFHLTRRRNALAYEIRKLKKAGKIQKFVTDENGHISIKGNATLHLYPHFKPLQEIDGVVDYLNTEISTSKQKKFSLVTFIDTPGLVDGDMKYPFDVNQSMLWLGDLCDLIFVFFDPIGQALCKRTLNIVEQLNDTHSERIRFYLSKADEAGHESDRQRVMMQIVQELCKRPGLNKTGFDMPTIYIPNPNKSTRCVNQIDEVCKDIEKTINQTIQNTLNQLEKDCEQISKLVDDAVKADDLARSYNFRARVKGISLSMFGFLLPVALMLQLLVASAPREVIRNLLGEPLAQSVVSFMAPATAFWETISDDNQVVVLGSVLAISGLCLLVSRFLNRSRPTLQRRSRKLLLEKREFVNTHVKSQKQKLYSEYLQQSVSDQDL